MIHLAKNTKQGHMKSYANHFAFGQNALKRAHAALERGERKKAKHHASVAVVGFRLAYKAAGEASARYRRIANWQKALDISFEAEDHLRTARMFANGILP